MSDGTLLALGCGVFFIFLAGVYVYIREESSFRAALLTTPNVAPVDASVVAAEELS